MTDTNNPKIVDAIYRDPIVPDYQGNPFIEALPSILSAEEVIPNLGYIPPFDPAERMFPNHIRMHCINRLKEWVEPLPEYCELWDMLGRTIRYGYVGRNPMHVETWQRLYAQAPNESLNASMIPRTDTTAGTLGMSGLSGVGKTTLFTTLLNLYPPAIYHREYKGKMFIHTQVVWIKISCPHDGSLGALCMRFFEELDRIVGTNYADQYRDKRIPRMIDGMRHVAAVHFIGVLIIDEFQNLSIAKGGGDEKMLNYFVDLVETVGIPMVLISTYKAIGLFKKSLRNSRRASTDGYLEFRRYTQDSPEWRLLVDRLWGYQWLRSPTPVPDPDNNDDANRKYLEEVVYELHDLTQGITAVLVLLFMKSQWRALRAGDVETINQDLLRETYNEELKLLHPALNALRRNTYEDLMAFDDLWPKSTDLAALFSPDSWQDLPIVPKGTPKTTTATPKNSKKTEDLSDCVQGWEEKVQPENDDPLDLRNQKDPKKIHQYLLNSGLIVDIKSLVQGIGT